MGIEHVGIGASIGITHSRVRIHQAQLILDDGQRMVTVEHTRPLAYLPAHRPATGGITTTHQRLVYALIDGRIDVWRHLVAGIGAPEV